MAADPSIAMPPQPLPDPREAAAAFLIAVAGLDGAYTEIDKDFVTQGLMKLFLMPNREAADLRRDVQDAGYANRAVGVIGEALKGLDMADRERLVERGWTLAAQSPEVADDAARLIETLGAAAGVPAARIAVLKPEAAAGA